MKVLRGDRAGCVGTVRSINSGRVGVCFSDKYEHIEYFPFQNVSKLFAGS